MNQTIKCGGLKELVEVCAALTQEGIAFAADTRTWMVVITGY